MNTPNENQVVIVRFMGDTYVGTFKDNKFWIPEWLYAQTDVEDTLVPLSGIKPDHIEGWAPFEERRPDGTTPPVAWQNIVQTLKQEFSTSEKAQDLILEMEKGLCQLSMAPAGA